MPLDIPLEHLRRAAVIGVEEADRNMLRTNKIASHVPGKIHSSFKHPLAAGGEGHVGGWGREGWRGGRSLLVPDGSDGLAGLVDGDPRSEKADEGALLGDEAEEEVLVEDHLLPQSARLPLGEDDGLDGPLGKPLEDGGDGSSSGSPRGGAAGGGEGEAGERASPEIDRPGGWKGGGDEAVGGGNGEAVGGGPQGVESKEGRSRRAAGGLHDFQDSTCVRDDDDDRTINWEEYTSVLVQLKKNNNLILYSWLSCTNNQLLSGVGGREEKRAGDAW